MIARSLLATTALVPIALLAQFQLEYDPGVPVYFAGGQYQMPWAGGINFSQWSNLDVDADGDQDLFCFDRSGNEVTILENLGGMPVQYQVTRDYESVYPLNDLHDWALLRDYNCDGKPDIFSYGLGGARVFRNTSSGSTLSFQLVTNLVYSNYQPTISNLYITQVDVPGIEDIDYDGDLDFITFSIFGSYLEYHRNLSMELYGTCDSLEFEIRNRCWGFFSESVSDNTVNLDDSCDYNVPNPELPPQPGSHPGLDDRTFLPTPFASDDDDAVFAHMKSAAHVGSTITPIDLDADSVRDVLLGDVIFANIVALSNDGTVDNNHMAAQDIAFPSYDVPVNLEIFPCAYYVHVDNDGKRDLICGANNTTLANNFQSVWYYRNTGTDAAPIFDFQQVNLFQDRMIERGEGAYPVLFDHNGDGLMDLLVSNYGYYAAGGLYLSKVALYLNTGSATAPEFELATDDFEGLSTSGIGQAIHPAFTDLDNDGDKDMYIGELQGKLYYFKNVGTPGTPDFQYVPVPATVLNDLGVAIDVGQFSKPFFHDMDGDGKTDMLVGERNGNINYYRNTGTLTAPLWHLENDTLGGVVVKEWWNVTGYSVPYVFINDLGQRELLVGSESGWVWDFDNIDGNLGGTFNLVDSTWQGLKEGGHSSVVLHDFDGNGTNDVVTGNYRGGLGYWRNDFGVSTSNHDNTSPADLFTLAPNPASGNVLLMVNRTLSTAAQAVVLDPTGREVLRRPVRDPRITLPTDGWSNGVYLVRLIDGDKSWSQRLVVIR